MDTIDDNPTNEANQPAANQPTSEPFTVTNKAGVTYLVDGKQARQLPNGAILAIDTGKIVANPAASGQPGATSGITTENHRDIREKLFERRLQSQLAAGSGMAKGTMTAGELQAWEKIAAAQAGLALDVERGRASTEAARFLGAATGFLAADARRDTDGGQPPALRLDLSPAAVDGLLALVAAWRGAAGSGEDEEDE